MKGLILVGGYGTRLRPLTLTVPKPLVEFGNRPMILHQIEALANAGVTDIVLAVNYRPEVMVETLKKYEAEYGVNITFSVETEPLALRSIEVGRRSLEEGQLSLLRLELRRHL